MIRIVNIHISWCRMKKIMLGFIIFLCFNSYSFSQTDPDADLKAVQDASVFTENHKLLEKFAGDWKINFVNYSVEAITPGMGEAVGSLIYNGRYLELKNNIDISGIPFQTTNLFCYDTRKKKYTFISYDNATNFPTIADGTYDKEKNMLLFEGKDYIAFYKADVLFRITINFDRENKITLRIFHVFGTKPPALVMESVYIKK